MNHSTYRRIRRRLVNKETAAHKKDNQPEQQFFGEATHEPFFKSTAQQHTFVQRKCADCEKEDKKVQKKSDGMEKKEDEKKLQKKSDGTEKKEEEKKLQKKETGIANTAGGGIGSYVGSLSSKGQSMPVQINNFFSSRIGYDFSKVKIHTGAEAANSAKAIHAKAYTVGNDIVFNDGAYQPETPAGKLLLAHELVHVIQQDNASIKNGLQRKADDAVPELDIPDPQLHAPLPPIWLEVQGSKIQNTTHNADCNGVSVSGNTSANYSSTGSLSGTPARATDCSGCTGADCITVSGTVVSRFSTAPVVSLPSVPGGLNDCERTAVSAFINGTLRQHEQQHVAAFNTYRGTVSTPISFTGCRANLQAEVQNMHDNVEVPRRAASDALSAALDANGANVFNITCQCPDPQPDAGNK